MAAPIDADVLYALFLSVSSPQLVSEERCKLFRAFPELRDYLSQGPPDRLQDYLECLVAARDLDALKKEIDAGLVSAAMAAKLLVSAIRRGPEPEAHLVDLLSRGFAFPPQETDEIIDALDMARFQKRQLTPEIFIVLAKNVAMDEKQHEQMLRMITWILGRELSTLNSKIPNLDLNSVIIDRKKYPLLWYYRRAAFPPSGNEPPQRKILTDEELRRYETALRTLAWYADSHARKYGEKNGWFHEASVVTRTSSGINGHPPYPGEKSYATAMIRLPDELYLHHPLLLKTYRELTKRP